nr:hypothetical protein Iba_chr05fCG9190 [Ipomoea batatas]
MGNLTALRAKLISGVLFKEGCSSTVLGSSIPSLLSSVEVAMSSLHMICNNKKVKRELASKHDLDNDKNPSALTSKLSLGIGTASPLCPFNLFAEF